VVNNWHLVFYETATGRSPVREYVDNLSAEEAARLTYDLKLDRFAV